MYKQQMAMIPSFHNQKEPTTYGTVVTVENGYVVTVTGMRKMVIPDEMKEKLAAQMLPEVADMGKIENWEEPYEEIFVATTWEEAVALLNKINE